VAPGSFTKVEEKKGQELVKRKETEKSKGVLEVLERVPNPRKWRIGQIFGGIKVPDCSTKRNKVSPSRSRKRRKREGKLTDEENRKKGEKQSRGKWGWETKNSPWARNQKGGEKKCMSTQEQEEKARERKEKKLDL